MSNKNMSPIVKTGARTASANHLRYRYSAAAGGHSDLLLIFTLCLLAYGLFIYFFLPTVASSQYTRVAAELSYYWQRTFELVEYRFYTVYLPYVQSLLQDGLALIGR